MESFDFYDDVGLTLSVLWQGQSCLLGCIWEQFMDFAKDFGANVNIVQQMKILRTFFL